MLVGRDGQEIEGECGRRLVGVIDEVGGVGGGKEEGEGEGDGEGLREKRGSGLRGGGGWEDGDGKGERWVGGEVGEESMVSV